MGRVKTTEAAEACSLTPSHETPPPLTQKRANQTLPVMPEPLLTVKVSLEAENSGGNRSM